MLLIDEGNTASGSESGGVGQSPPCLPVERKMDAG